MNRLHKQPTVTYVPGIPGVAARPAYCTTRRVFAGYKEEPAGGEGYFIPVGSIASNTGVSLPAGAQIVYRQVLNTLSGQYETEIAGWMVMPPVIPRRVPVYRNVYECYPAVVAVEAVPARVDYGDSIGWNGGARSIEPVPAAGYFECTIPSSGVGGIVIGLSDGRAEHTYAHASHALVFRPTGVTPISYGLPVGAEMPYSPGAAVRFERYQRRVDAHLDGVLLHSFDLPLSGTAYVDATLYGIADYVDNPVIGVLPAGISGTASPAVAVITDATYGYVDGHAAAPLAELIGGMLIGVSGVAASAVGLIGSVAAASISAIASRPTASFVHGEPTIVQAGIAGVAARPLLAAFSPAVVVGAIDGVAAAPSALIGADPYCAIDASWGANRTMTMWQSYMPEGLVDGAEVMFAFDYSSLASVLMFVSYEQISVGEPVDLVLVTSMQAYEMLMLSEHATLGGVINLLAMERVLLTGASHAGKKEALQYAVNAVTGALSEYRGFGFKQFARMGGETYAITDAGLYRLGAEGDAGETINALIDFGASDFGTARSKRINSVYAGIATDGEVYLRVTGDDGKEAIYKAVGDGVERRARTAKGVTARHWRLRLELVDAVYADLDNIEIELGVSQRRLRR